MDFGSVDIMIVGHYWHFEGLSAVGITMLIVAPILLLAYRVAFY